ncbi:MAG: hypothetical protein PVH80_08290 [Anaerolineae bacterium]
MTKERVGLAMFWISAIWMISWVFVGALAYLPLMRSLTMEEMNQTVWAFRGFLQSLYGLSMPLGATVAGVGVLLYARARGLTIWAVGIGSLIALAISLVALALNLYSPPLFGIGGTLILLSFIGILWLWAKERMALKGSSTAAADFRLVGYVFMLMAAWWI